LRETANWNNGWYLFLEITFKNDREKLIASLFHKYEYLVDKIVVLPNTSKNLNIIDFSPLEEFSICKWTVNTLYVTSDLKLNLCEKSNKIQYDFSFESDSQLKSDRGNLDVCKSCLFKSRANGYVLELDSNPWIKDLDESSTVLHNLFQEYLFFFLSEIADKDLTAAYNTIISQGEFVFEQRTKNILLQFANKLIDYELFSYALDVIEIILKTDPVSQEAHKILDKLCVQLN